MTFKDLWNEIQGLSSTCPVFKYFQDLEFRRKNQVLSSTFKDAWEPCRKHSTVYTFAKADQTNATAEFGSVFDPQNNVGIRQLLKLKFNSEINDYLHFGIGT